MQLNVAFPTHYTHEGAPAKNISPMQQLRRSVTSCLLWEREFYEDGEEISKRIIDLVGKVPPQQVADLAVEVRTRHNIRHAPLMLVSALSKHCGGKVLEDAVFNVIQRADELTELLAIHAQLNGVSPSMVKKKIPAAMKRGLARAFHKFSEYQLAKYNRDTPIKLRDVLFLCHAKPYGDGEGEMWRRLIDNQLITPDTWEVQLSTGKDKRETFERLMREGNIGYLALLRNLRNMVDAGCDTALMREAIRLRKGAQRVLPFRYVAAARACPQLEPEIDRALCAAISYLPNLKGTTFIVVDVSGSMRNKLSAKSDMTRMDAAAALASITNGNRRVFTFSSQLVEVPPRTGMSGVDAIIRSQPHASTQLGAALGVINQYPHDRIIVITDEQSHDRVPDPGAKHAYMINVASASNGVGYGRWTHIDGFSENVIKFIYEMESEL